jgi:hypothetical protein
MATGYLLLHHSHAAAGNDGGEAPLPPPPVPVPAIKWEEMGEPRSVSVVDYAVAVAYPARWHQGRLCGILIEHRSVDS